MTPAYTLGMRSESYNAFKKHLSSAHLKRQHSYIRKYQVEDLNVICSPVLAFKKVWLDTDGCAVDNDIELQQNRCIACDDTAWTQRVLGASGRGKWLLSLIKAPTAQKEALNFLLIPTLGSQMDCRRCVLSLPDAWTWKLGRSNSRRWPDESPQGSSGGQRNMEYGNCFASR